MMLDFLMRIIGRHPELFGPPEQRRQAIPPFAEVTVYPDAEQLHGVLARAETQEEQDDATIGVFRLLIEGMTGGTRAIPAIQEPNRRGEVPMSYAEAQRAAVSPAPRGNPLHLASGFKIGA